MQPDVLPYFKHPMALVEATDVGAGTRIWAFTHVMQGAHIGERCNLCDHVFVESNVHVGNDVTLKNGVALWDALAAAAPGLISRHAAYAWARIAPGPY